MADDPEKPMPGSGAAAAQGHPTPPFGEPAASAPDEPGRDRDRGISDIFRRAVAVGLEAAGRSKDDFVRIASNEVRTWLDHLELDTELRKALSKMVLEVKAEIRFRQTDDGQLVSQTDSDVKVKPAPGKPDRDRQP